MIKVGLTGGYATGKSFVAAQLARLGCHVIYADRLGHKVLEPDGEAYRPTLDLFGPEILTPEGVIDRKRLAEIVFASAELLEKLNAFVHPAVFRLEEKLLQEFESQDPNGIAVIEAAILIETGRYRNFDRLILTVCREETQIKRAMSRDGLSEEQVLARLAKQMPSEEKEPYASYTINTDGLKAETIKRVQEVHRELKTLAERSRP